MSGLFETELGEVIGAVAKSDNEYSAGSFPGASAVFASARPSWAYAEPLNSGLYLAKRFFERKEVIAEKRFIGLWKFC